MAERTSYSDQNLESVFRSSLLDASGQPNLIIDSSQSHKLIWTLVNNATGSGQDLVVTPFTSGPVGPNQYHFLFGFAPGTLTDPPTLQGWDVGVQKDVRGGITSLYIALSGSAPLSIPPGGDHKTTLIYTKAIQEDPHSSTVAVTLTAGSNVAIANTPIKGKQFGPFDLTLIQANTPTLSAPVLSLDFVGRRTVLNDGETPNSFTFALTNMTQAALALTPTAGDAKGSPTVFSVWFDAAPNQPAEPYPWALARIEDLASDDVVLTPPSSDWTPAKVLAKPEVIAGNPQWDITVSKAIVLGQQDPVFFKFSGIKTDLAPGVTRMYLRYKNLPGFPDGVLIGELEKTPLLYGASRGQGLYLSAGKPTDNTPPAPNYDSALFIQQFGPGAVATFQGRGNTHPIATFQSDGKVGIGTPTPGFPLSFPDTFGDKISLWGQSGANTGFGIQHLLLQIHTLDSNSDVVFGYGASDSMTETMRIGGNGRVGIGTTSPQSKLEIALDEKDKTTDLLRIGKGSSKYLTIQNDARIGIGTSSPQAKLDIALDAQDTTTDLLRVGKGATNHLTIGNTGNVGIGTADTQEAKLTVVTQTKNTANNTATFFAPQIGPNSSHIHFGSTGDWHIRSASPEGKVLMQDTGGSTVVGGTLSVGGTLTVTGASLPPQLVLGGDAASAWVVDQSKGALRIYRQANGPNDTPQLVLGNVLSLLTEIDCYFPAKSKWYRLTAGEKPGGYEWASWAPLSDIRLKEDVRPLTGALENVNRLRGVLYRWSDTGLHYLTQPRVNAVSAGPDATEEQHEALRRAERQEAVAKLSDDHLGLIAQEVEAIVPEAVYENEDGHKCIRYPQLVALLIEAIKEQDQTVKAHTKLMAQQQAEIDRLTNVQQAMQQQLAELAAAIKAR